MIQSLTHSDCKIFNSLIDHLLRFWKNSLVVLPLTHYLENTFLPKTPNHVSIPAITNESFAHLVLLPLLFDQQYQVLTGDSLDEARKRMKSDNYTVGVRISQDVCYVIHMEDVNGRIAYKGIRTTPSNEAYLKTGFQCCILPAEALKDDAVSKALEHMVAQVETVLTEMVANRSPSGSSIKPLLQDPVTVPLSTLEQVTDDMAALINDYQQATGRHHVPGYRAWNNLQLMLVDAGHRGVYDGVLPGQTEKPLT